MNKNFYLDEINKASYGIDAGATALEIQRGIFQILKLLLLLLVDKVFEE